MSNQTWNRSLCPDRSRRASISFVVAPNTRFLTQRLRAKRLFCDIARNPSWTARRIGNVRPTKKKDGIVSRPCQPPRFESAALFVVGGFVSRRFFLRGLLTSRGAHTGAALAHLFPFFELFRV